MRQVAMMWECFGGMSCVKAGPDLVSGAGFVVLCTVFHECTYLR